jgi:hypothetical protein
MSTRNPKATEQLGTAFPLSTGFKPSDIILLPEEDVDPRVPSFGIDMEKRTQDSIILLRQEDPDKQTDDPDIDTDFFDVVDYEKDHNEEKDININK